MSESSHEVPQEVIEELIGLFANHEPPFSSLGTPFIADTETTQSLVRMGKAAVPALVRTLDSAHPKIVMYAAYCLGLIGDRSVLPALQQTKAKYTAKQPKEAYDFGAVSAATQAEERLLASSP